MTTANPKISIVLPTYNGSKYIRQAIESCLNQTYRHIELVVVDDCSTDNTPEIIRSFTDHRIKYIRNEKNQRLPRSLNIGFAAATGDYLTWTSDDNQYLPAALEEMLRFLESRPDVDFVYTDMHLLDLEKGQRTLKTCTHSSFYFENGIGACYLYTRRVYEAIGEFNPRLEWMEDYDYWLRVEKKFAMRRLAKTLYLYGDHPQSLTSLRYWPIHFLAHLLRFHHGYLSFDGLAEAVGGFISKFLPFRKESFGIWRTIVQKVLGMNLKLRMAFVCGIICALYKKMGFVNKRIRKKILRMFNKDRRFQDILSGLPQGNPGKTQILCVIPFLSMGGSEKVMQDVARGLSPKGYDFHLFCFSQDDNPWVKEFLTSFVSYVGIPVSYDVDLYTDYLIQIIQKLNIKIILLTNAHITYKCLAKIREVFPELKVIDIIHLERVGGTHKHISTVGAPYVDRRVCISHHLLTHMKQEYGAWGLPMALADRLRVIHNGTDLMDFSRETIVPGKFRRQYRIPEDAKIISFVARMTNEKNPFIFVDIAQGILAKNPAVPLRFIMAGYGPLLSSVKSKIRDYGLEEHFVLPGAVTNIGELFKDSFLLILVSTHEGIPLAIQEAMLMNVPVISTRVGAIHEIIKDGSSGFLIEKDENMVDGAMARMEYLLNHEKEYQEMAVRAREESYPEFTLETMSRRYEELFLEVLNLNANETVIARSREAATRSRGVSPRIAGQDSAEGQPPRGARPTRDGIEVRK